MSGNKQKINKVQLENHNKLKNEWVVVNGKVYDLSKYYSKHPGEKNVTKKEGKDGQDIFDD